MSKISILIEKKYSADTLFLSAENTLIKTEEELLAFDFEDLINGLGGALGLFLGWSLLHIFNQCFQFFINIHGKYAANIMNLI